MPFGGEFEELRAPNRSIMPAKDERRRLVADGEGSGVFWSDIV